MPIASIWTRWNALALCAAVVGCSSPSVQRGIVQGSGGTSGAGNSPSSGGMGGVTFNVGGGAAVLDGGRPERCDDAGNCSCITIASYGRPGHYGSRNDNTDEFQNWLNTKSSASVELIVTHTPITAALLANYDIFILQALEDAEHGPFWQFAQSEIDALTQWVQGGGGLIALTGYGRDAGEVTSTNQLLAFAGISYETDDIFGSCPNSLNCYCWGLTIPVTTWNAAHPIAASISQVGAYHGRSITSSGTDLVASEGGVPFAVTKQVGNGKVLVLADEWITYTSQWLGQPQAAPNPNDPCYDTTNQWWMTADKVFQVPQFWYNAITWVAPITQCAFTLDDPTIIY